MTIRQICFTGEIYFLPEKKNFTILMVLKISLSICQSVVKIVSERLIGLVSKLKLSDFFGVEI